MSNTLFVAWRSDEPTLGGWAPVGRLEYHDGLFRFVYTRGALTSNAFRPFPAMQDVHAIYESESLFPLFANRRLSPSRPEYEAYLAWGGFDPANPPDPLVILGVTEGIRQTDALEVFPCPNPDVDGRYVSKFFLHGIRWMPHQAIERIARLQRDEPLGLMLELSNKYDPRAVAVRTLDDQDRFMIGYVPRYLARDVWSLCAECHPDAIRLTVERVNPDAPTQMRLLCRMSACWPEGFQPCSGVEFDPIANAPTQSPPASRASR